MLKLLFSSRPTCSDIRMIPRPGLYPNLALKDASSLTTGFEQSYSVDHVLLAELGLGSPDSAETYILELVNMGKDKSFRRLDQARCVAGISAEFCKTTYRGGSGSGRV